MPDRAAVSAGGVAQTYVPVTCSSIQLKWIMKAVNMTLGFQNLFFFPPECLVHVIACSFKC